jgi:hypothetical protein
MSKVFVLDTNKQPLNPVHPGRARLLLKQGTYVGKVAVRTRGTFNITTAHGLVTDIHHRFCVLVARSDGYTYQQGKEVAFPPSA